MPQAPTSDLEARFFLLRTPLLPFGELMAWSAGLESPAAAASGDPERLATAVAADRERLREQLRRLVGRPEIREALFVASPSLEEGLAAWLRDPEGKKGRRAEESLVRYVQRMVSRATPFGLFSGCSTGVVGSGTSLRLAGREDYGRRSRLDMDYLFTLAGDLQRVPELRRELRFKPNSSLYRAAGRLRYAESRREGGELTHQLVAVDTNELLEEVLRQARTGATPDELAAVLVAADPDGEISAEEAAEFIGELIDSQILTSDLSPPVTGLHPVEDLMDQLREHAGASPLVSEVIERLERARATLAELDGASLGCPPERYRAVARDLEALPTGVELSFLFQVDMVKPAPGLSIGPEVIGEIERGISLMRRILEPDREDSLSRFRQEFVDRYDRGREVPLVEALDEEMGIGFERSRSIGTEGSPLLAGIVFPQQAGGAGYPKGLWHERLLAKVVQARIEGASGIEITEADLKDVEDRLPPQPASFQVMGALAAADEEALARGDFKFFLRLANGPPGSRLLGRFCHLDPELHRHLEEHLREEEALEPDAVFAEIAHLPRGRSGNVLWRPVLREWEIPFLGRSGAPPDRWLPVDDLLVSVQGTEIVLRSKRLGKRVLPRLSSAHVFSRRSLGMYNFLGSLQAQGTREGLFWSWGGLEGLDFLPRVTSGRLVLARARWRIPPEEVTALTSSQGADRFQAAQAWRERRRLPRWVVFVELDHELLVDLDNPLSLDAFVSALRGRQTIDLLELFPGPDELAVSGPEGRFVSEVIIPFHRRREAAARRTPVSSTIVAAPEIRRTFPPGSEWLYAKLYTGTSTADTVLRDLVAPLVADAMGSGAADSWFFLRYADPQWHLRLRFHGDPRRLHGEVLPRLQEGAAALMEEGLLWSFQTDTYQREIERYGGPEGIELAERLFHVDSEAVLAILESLEGPESADARWRLALRGLDLLFSDLGFTGPGKLGILQQVQATLTRENGGFVQQLAQRLRRERASLAPYLEREWDPERPDAAAFAALERRSRSLAPIVAELRERERAGRLTSPITERIASYTHMFANRIFRSEGNAHETVIYDFLLRLHQSRAAREAGKET